MTGTKPQRRPAADPRSMREPTAGELAGMKGWAWRLRQREIDGDNLGVCQRRFWREALGVAPGGAS